MAVSHFVDFRKCISLFQQLEQYVSMCKYTKKRVQTEGIVQKYWGSDV